jgi:HSP90 family molecular chaperone
MAESGKAKVAEEKKEGEVNVEDKQDDVSGNYETFWAEYGKSIKFGVIDDRKNRAKLVSLLRYRTSASDGKEVSLESYVSRMKEGQKRIYYMTGESDDKIKKSPFLEKVIEKGYEVIYMSDPLDEYVVGAVTEFDGAELQSVAKENLKLDEDDKENLKKDKEAYKPLTEWFGKVYGDKVEKVVVSNRLGSSPCVLVTGQYGMTANMQRIVKGSTLQSHEGVMAPKKTLEINVHHPILKAINDKIVEDAEDASLVDMANILLDSALVTSGFTVTDYAPFYNRMTKVISAGLGLDPNAKAEEEIPDEPEAQDDEDEPAPKKEKKPKRKAQDDDEGHEEL